MNYQLREIEIKNYRSIAEAKLSSSDGKFILIGKNNVGKTNILQFIADVLRIDGYSNDNPAWNIHYTRESAYLDSKEPLSLVLKYKILDPIGMPRLLLDHTVEINGEKYLVITFLKKHDSSKGEFFIGRTDIDYPEYVKKERQIYFNALFIPSLRTLDPRHKFQEMSSVIGNISLEKTLGYCIRVFVKDKKRQLNNVGELLGVLQKSLAGDFIKVVAPEIEVNLITIEGLDKINQQIQELKKDTTDEFSIGKEIARTIRISVKDNKFGKTTPVKDVGEGFQNLLIIQLYLEMERLYPGNCILLIDEIESNLHPPLLKKVIKYIINSKMQAVISTHSPIIIPETKFHQVHYIKKGVEGGCAKSKVFKLTPKEEHKNRIVKELTVDSSELFFADKVVLVEGPSDRFFLQKVADLVDNKNNLTFIETHSKDNFHVFTNILSQLHINHAIITDIDAVSCAGISKVLEQKQIKLMGNLEEKIKSLQTHNIYILKRGEIEDYYPKDIIAQIAGVHTIQDFQRKIETNKFEEKKQTSGTAIVDFLRKNMGSIISKNRDFKMKHEATTALEKTLDFTVKLWNQTPADREIRNPRKTSKIYKILTSKNKPQLSIEVCKMIKKEQIPYELRHIISSLVS